MFPILLLLRPTTSAQLVLTNGTEGSVSNGRGASNAIDGDLDTEYHSLTSDFEWIQFDLQDPAVVSTVTLVGR